MKKALIVEDFKLIADIWHATLIEEGFEFVEVVRNSDEVETAIEKVNPSIILMDINLPGKLNGLELTDKLLKSNPSLKILILTIHTEPTYIYRAIESGAKGYVTKNSSLTELKRAINEILNGNKYLCEEVRSN
jgi:DNA-binding NarL/FixJ family response regulator